MKRGGLETEKDDRTVVLEKLILFLCTNWGETGDREISLDTAELVQPDHQAVPRRELKHKGTEKTTNLKIHGKERKY